MVLLGLAYLLYIFFSSKSSRYCNLVIHNSIFLQEKGNEKSDHSIWLIICLLRAYLNLCFSGITGTIPKELETFIRKDDSFIISNEPISYPFLATFLVVRHHFFCMRSYFIATTNKLSCGEDCYYSHVRVQDLADFLGEDTEQSWYFFHTDLKFQSIICCPWC